MPYCLYLRKSRADVELEAQGEMETLARHQTILLSLAKRQNLTITKIYKEIVSGETISERPEVQQLLNEVEDGVWEGVLVVEIERLARGDTIDQGVVARAFKYGNTKIITPTKTYDPGNEFDEEYFEFGLFMSRREYKTINRRIQRGRIAAIKEGKFISSTPPYGYDKVKTSTGKGYTLAFNSESDVVKDIYRMYLSGSGMRVICNNLDIMGIKPRNRDTWSKSTVSDILKNPVYTGVIRWSYRPEKKLKDNSKVRYQNEDCIVVNGLHPAIISKEDFERAQSLLKANYRLPVKKNLELKNPLSGLGYCAKCGTLLTRLGASTRNKVDKIMCSNKDCNTVSAPIDIVEKEIISQLKDVYKNYSIDLSGKSKDIDTQKMVSDKAISNIKSSIKKVDDQISKTYDLLEQGVYTIAVFEERNHLLNEKKQELTKSLQLLELQQKENKSDKIVNDFVLKAQFLLDRYYDIQTAEGRNKVLRLLLEKFEYSKTERNTRGHLYDENFKVIIYPKLPIS